MPRTAALLAGATLLVAAPLAAQAGPGSVPRSVTLTATRPASASVTVVGAVSSDSGQVRVSVRTSWNTDPAEPFGLSLEAYFEPRLRDGERPGESAGGQKSLAGIGEIGMARPALPAQPASEAGPRGSRTEHVQLRIGLLGRSASPPGTLSLVAITQ